MNKKLCTKKFSIYAFAALFFCFFLLPGGFTQVLDGLDQEAAQAPKGTQTLIDSSSELISTIDYKVKSGDCLWQIALKTLNDSSLWPKLASYNNLLNPNLIFPGQIIQIPIDWFNGTITDVTAPSTPAAPSTPGSQGTTAGTVTPPASNPGTTAPGSTNSGSTVDWGNAPNHGPVNFPASEVTAGTPKYKGWVDSALSSVDTSRCPSSMKDKYGNEISKDLLVKAITWIESSGRHTKNGKVIENAWGFTGFMQLSKGFGEGRFDPAQNIKLGTRYLFESCMKSASPPAGSSKIYNSKDSEIERVIKAAVGYNRGPYATSKNISGKLKSGELALEHSWQDVVASARTDSYMTEGVHYGIKFKACLGIELTSTERSWIKKYRGYSDSELDSWCNSNYSSIRHM
jgi:LysM repeat protein